MNMTDNIHSQAHESIPPQYSSLSDRQTIYSEICNDLTIVEQSRYQYI